MATRGCGGRRQVVPGGGRMALLKAPSGVTQSHAGRRRAGLAWISCAAPAYFPLRQIVFNSGTGQRAIVVGSGSRERQPELRLITRLPICMKIWWRRASIDLTCNAVGSAERLADFIVDATTEAMIAEILEKKSAPVLGGGHGPEMDY